jgi:DNA-binding Xre family transcriptional regulator
MVKYYKLFDLLKRKDMKLSDLRNVISSATVAKLNKGQYISGECIDKICRYLQCQPNDIMEIVEDENEKETRELFEKATDSMYDSMFNLLLQLSHSKNISMKELWNKQLEQMSTRRQNSADFQALKKYIENRIEETENSNNPK